MEDKTEHLRDIFVETAGEEAVTEPQQEGRGSLTEDEQRTNERLERVVARMREELGFETDLDDPALRELVRGFYTGEDDADLAARLDESEEAVFRARMDLHLIREDDTGAPFELSELRDLIDEGSTAEAADRLGIDEASVRHYRAVVEARDEARRESHRFRSEFEDVLTDAGLSVRHAAAVREDGLEDATDGMETDVSL